MVDWNLVAGAVIGAAATMLAVWPQLARTKREAAAAYVEEMAVAALGMAQLFKNREIPSDYGHTFNGLVMNYARKIGPYVGERLHDDVDRFLEIARRAEDIDAWLALRDRLNQEELDELIRDLRRLAGDLRAEARILRLG